MREFQKIIYFCFIDYARAFDYVDHNKILAVSSRDENSWKVLKILQEMGMPDHLTCLLRNMYAGQKATVRTVRTWTGSKSGKEYVKAIYCHPDFLTYMQSTS